MSDQNMRSGPQGGLRMSDQDSLLSKLVGSRAVQTEGMCRVEELESARNKLQAKIVESEELVDSLTTKVANAEKSKTRMNNELDDLVSTLKIWLHTK